MNETTSLGRWLKQRRKALDITQVALAARVPCSVETIRKIEADALRPSRQLAALLADALQLPGEDREAFVRFARMGESAQGVDPPSIDVPASGLRPTNFYGPPTSFVGREHELGRVRALLARDDARLVTLLGPAGIGKTRLSIEAASGIEGFEDGVFFV